MAVVSNARCLVEGYDLPAVDMVFFCDPKCSTTDIVQAAGRALRLDGSRPDKKGLIVLPVFHASKGELDETLAAGDFQRVADVLAALSDVDEVLKGEIALRSSREPDEAPQQEPAGDAAQEDGLAAGQPEAPKVVVTGFDGRLAKALFEQAVKGTPGGREPWQDACRALLQFREENPDRWPASSEKSPEGLDLWKWVRAQRRANRGGTLSDAHRRVLDEIGILAEARPCWLVQYQRLRSYAAMHPGKWPAKGTEHPVGNRLGAWCASQRHARRDGTLSKERVQLLDGLGFPWGRDAASPAEVLTSSREESRAEVTVSV